MIIRTFFDPGKTLNTLHIFKKNDTTACPLLQKLDVI